MESNLHNFNSPVSNVSTIVGTNINKSYDVNIKNSYSFISEDVIDNFGLLINNIHSFKNILETLGDKSIYRWNDIYIWDDINIWSDVELN